MNKTVKKIGELRRMLSYINFKDNLTSKDYIRMDEIEAELSQLRASLKGTKGVAVKLTRNGSNGYSFYLTDDDVLCCGDEPTLFESEDEAQDYLDRARIVPSDYKIEFIEMTY